MPVMVKWINGIDNLFDMKSFVSNYKINKCLLHQSVYITKPETIPNLKPLFLKKKLIIDEKMFSDELSCVILNNLTLDTNLNYPEKKGLRKFNYYIELRILFINFFDMEFIVSNINCNFKYLTYTSSNYLQEHSIVLQNVWNSFSNYSFFIQMIRLYYPKKCIERQMYLKGKKYYIDDINIPYDINKIIYKYKNGYHMKYRIYKNNFKKDFFKKIKDNLISYNSSHVELKDEMNLSVYSTLNLFFSINRSFRETLLRISILDSD